MKKIIMIIFLATISIETSSHSKSSEENNQESDIKIMQCEITDRGECTSDPSCFIEERIWGPLVSCCCSEQVSDDQ